MSIGTVDRVIHKRGEVSESTRIRVQKLLEEYNYTPDIMASSLALKKPVRLAVLMPGGVDEHAFWKLPQSGIRKAMEELAHFNLSVETFQFNQFEPGDFLRCIRHFPFEEFQGLLFAPVFREESISFLNRCEKWNLPVVLFNSFLDVPSIRCFVGQDAFQSGYVAGRLIHYGMGDGGRVAIINMSARTDHYSHIVSREKGFRTYFETHGTASTELITFDLNGADDGTLTGQLEEACSEHDLDGLYVTNSRVHKVAEFLAGKDQRKARLVGYDLLPESVAYLRRGLIDFLISQKPDEQAFHGLSSLFYLVAFHREPEARRMLPIDIITRENLDYYQPLSYQ